VRVAGPTRANLYAASIMRPGRHGRRSSGGGRSGIRGCLLPLLVLACLLSGLVVLPSAAAKPDARRRGVSGLLAPAGTCQDEHDEDAPPSDQDQAMLCLIEFARHKAGLPGLASSSELARSAREKSDAILRCDSFSHFACHRYFTFWMRRVGFLPAQCWRVAENLAWGRGVRGSARRAMRALIHSPEHRRNIFGNYTLIGVGLKAGRLNGHANAHVWTQHFGSHCGPIRSGQ
jgi:uncharacterized protein YkwD